MRALQGRRHDRAEDRTQSPAEEREQDQAGCNRGGAAFKRATRGYDRCMYIGLGTLLLIIILLIIIF